MKTTTRLLALTRSILQDKLQPLGLSLSLIFLGFLGAATATAERTQTDWAPRAQSRGAVARLEVDRSEPGWSPVVIATGDYRESIKAMPIEQRPYRPLHFYGNTVRRLHYRGTPLPVPTPWRSR